jgi:hypothetical protein
MAYSCRVASPLERLLWPRKFGLMVGISSFSMNIFVFLAFLILPKLADSQSDFDLDNSGTDFALLIVVLCSVVSNLASYLVVVAMKFEKGKTDKKSTSALVANTFSAFGRAVIPQDGNSTFRAILNLPPAFYLAILGNKAINYFFNTFSLFSHLYLQREFWSIPIASVPGYGSRLSSGWRLGSVHGTRHGQLWPTIEIPCGCMWAGIDSLSSSWHFQ